MRFMPQRLPINGERPILFESVGSLGGIEKPSKACPAAHSPTAYTR
jgi:hypothetical protein